MNTIEKSFTLTAKGAILLRLREAGKPLAVHELSINGYSENSLASRLSELAKAGLVKGDTRKGHAYKEWSIPAA